MVYFHVSSLENFETVHNQCQEWFLYERQLERTFYMIYEFISAIEGVCIKLPPLGEFYLSITIMKITYHIIYFKDCYTKATISYRKT